MAKLAVKSLVAALFAVFMMLNPVFAQAPHYGDYQFIDTLKPIIEHLSWCESRDNPLAVNPNDPDTPSYGVFQFKEATWHYYLDRYGLFPDAEKAERMNLIWDGWTQEVVARLILQEPEGWRNWTNCLKAMYE